MALFNVPKRPGREHDTVIAKKSATKARSTTTVKGSGLLGQINQIKAMVEKYLGKFKGKYVIETEVRRGRKLYPDDVFEYDGNAIKVVKKDDP